MRHRALVSRCVCCVCIYDICPVKIGVKDKRLHTQKRNFAIILLLLMCMHFGVTHTVGIVISLAIFALSVPKTPNRLFRM